MNDVEGNAKEVADAELVARARDGDTRALDALVRRHTDAAFRVALSYVKEEDTARDVVQDAFLKAFRSLDKFRGDAAFKTWLMTITANEARGVLRKVKRWKEQPIEHAAPVPDDGVDPARAAVLADEAARARSLLERLPEKQRLSVSLRVDEGLSFREIGAVIGSSEGAARVNYFHGIRRLRELME